MLQNPEKVVVTLPLIYYLLPVQQFDPPESPAQHRVDALASLPASFFQACGFCFVPSMLCAQALHLLKCNRSWAGSLFYVVEVVFRFTHIFLDMGNTKKKKSAILCH